MNSNHDRFARRIRSGTDDVSLSRLRLPWTALIVYVLSLAMTPSAHAQRAGQSTTIRVGQVISVQTVDLKDGNAVGGALVGGAFGAAISGTSSSSRSRNRNAAIGALLGGAAASSQRQQGRIYRVTANDGTIMQVATEQTEIRIGDCVYVEQAGGGTNIRRAPLTACQAESREVLSDKDVEEDMRRDAEICFSARQELADAQDDAAFDRAARKVKLLCYD